MSNHNLQFLIVMIALLLGGSLGLFIGQNTVKRTVNPLVDIPNSIYTSQTASIQGKITKISGKIVTVQNVLNNLSASFEVVDKVFINKPSINPTLASPSSDLTTIETDKNAVIYLEFQGNKYKITSISYLSSTPVATQSSILPPPAIK